MKHLIFSKQCDHDLDLVPLWFRYYTSVYRADCIVVTPVKTPRSEIRGVCAFYRDHGVPVHPIEIERWDDQLVWDTQLGIIRPYVGQLGSSFTAISADTDQFFQPLDDQLQYPDVAFRRHFVYAPETPRLDRLGELCGAVDLTCDLVGGFVNTLDNPRIGLTGHFHGLIPRTSIRRELHFCFRGERQFEEKLRGLAVQHDGGPGASHWKEWQSAVEQSGARGADEIMAPMLARSAERPGGDPVLRDFAALIEGRSDGREVRCLAPFASQLFRNAFELVTPLGIRRFLLIYPVNELDGIREVLLSGCYEIPDGLDVRRVLDIGANVGLFTALVRAQHPEAVVRSIEATPDTAGVLIGNFAGDQQVEVVSAAVSDRVEQAAWFIDPFLSTNDSLEGTLPRMRSVHALDTIDAESLAGSFGGEPIDVLKISVNGATRRLLSRMSAFLPRVGCLMLRYESPDERDAILGMMPDGFSRCDRPLSTGGVVVARR